MAAEGERPGSTSSGRTSEPSAHFTTGGGWGHPPVPPVDEDTAELLALLGEVRSDLARLRSTDEITALGDECDAAMGEISRTGRVTLDLVTRLRARLAAAAPVPSALASGIALARTLDVVAARPSTPRPAAEPPTRAKAKPSGRAHPGEYGTPAGVTPPAHAPGHTPPGPSTGSDDDEWPDPADG
ncbi:hypothetical protein OR263_34000 [Streptomyces sp. NEAU-H22]|uniref:hypothetical protein n=1 Tax=Streptomyces sp. NEAU-H22 TaxID=2994655 RepID=UPI00224EA05C|nr:hypothetical protein [Streptomyces sp. NEAU-H22]MCX3291664.1 hypothetical protein [Streptomyces sp. NEAU-H22]